MQIGVVGLGWVGSSVAISTLHSGVANELLLHDVKEGLAEGEAMDLRQGASFYPNAHVRSASVEAMADADAVVVAAGRGGGPRESRLELLRENASVVRDIARRLRGARGLLVIVTNPVDVMTHVAVHASGLPAERVLGTGTMLDTARLREIIGREMRVSARSVHAQVLGEHGDSEFVHWSEARIGGVPLRRLSEWDSQRESAIAEEVRSAAYEIIRRKGATNHAIGLVTASLLRSVLRNECRALTVSRLQTGAFELHDVVLSLPAIVGAEGASRVLEPPLEESEQQALQRSAAVLRDASAQVRER
jgi:L-lactate dehydrogenase